MKLIHGCCSLLAIVALLISAASAQSLDLRQSIGLFSQNLFNSLDHGQTNANIIISPFSVLTDLAMAWFGARQQTASEMQAALQLSGGTRSEIGTSFRSLLQPLQQESSVVKVVNRIYVQQTYCIRPQYNQLVERAFFARAQSLDFGQSQAAADVINAYVASNTHGLIKNLVDASLLSADTRMVLINAVYFKSVWKTSFNTRSTYKEAFYVNGDLNGETVQLDFMHQKNRLLFSDLPELNAIIVGLPYKDEEYCMHVILPNADVGLANLRSSLTGMDLSTFRKRMDFVNIRLSMPKFTTRYRTSLNQPLQRLGIRAAFSDEADFGGLLVGINPVFISDVIHEAYIAVDEAGTEAAAATGVVMNRRSTSVVKQEKIVRINRPFLYYIADKQSNVYFYGQFSGQTL